MIRPVEYRRMASISETCRALASLGTGARVLAGGTDLIVALRNDTDPGDLTLLDIGSVPGIGEIREEGDHLLIGARATFSRIARSPLVRRFAAPLAEAAGKMGNPQIRNRATIGGNVCNASPCADSVPALVALDARLHIVTHEGDRQLSVEETIDGPYSTTIGPEALLTEVWVPKVPAGARTAYVRLARRRAAAKARMAVAVVLVPGPLGRLADVRIGCGSVTPRPRRMRKAEDVLRGALPTEERIRECGSAVSSEMIAETGVRWSTEYKAPVVASLVARALREAMGRDEMEA